MSGPVEGFPAGPVMQVGVESGEEGRVQGDGARFETVPEPGGGGARDGVVYPAWGDTEAELVVENGLEGGDDLGVLGLGVEKEETEAGLSFLHRRRQCQTR